MIVVSSARYNSFTRKSNVSHTSINCKIIHSIKKWKENIEIYFFLYILKMWKCIV